MIQQLDQNRFASIDVSPQFREDRQHPIKGRISFPEVAILRATTMFHGFSDISVP